RRHAGCRSGGSGCLGPLDACPVSRAGVSRMRARAIGLPCVCAYPARRRSPEVPGAGPRTESPMRRAARWSVAALVVMQGLLVGVSPVVVAQDAAGPEV